MRIQHTLTGTRRIEVERAGHYRIVAERGGRGYVQRPYLYRGREYGHRTYYVNGRSYDRFYSPYRYRGAYVEMYTPVVYYRPAFYGWAYNPWGAPVPYAWGWASDPWYGTYGYYFAPYPAYPGASYWLTDYLVSNSLAESYQAGISAAADGQTAAQQMQGDASPLTPQVKDQIAAEVQRQISIELAEAQTASQNAAPNPALSGVQSLLNDQMPHVFVASRDLDVVDANGAECAIGEADALQLGAQNAEGTAASLVVLASKGGRECRRGTTVSVSVADLQEMENHMREVIDQGMGELQAKQGAGGLPIIPAVANAPPVKAPFAADAATPGPEPGAAAEIGQQTLEADQAERQIVDEPRQAPAPSRFTPASGQTIDEVRARLGDPVSQSRSGIKQIYIYPNAKITFENGKVVDIQ